MSSLHYDTFEPLTGEKVIIKDPQNNQCELTIIKVEASPYNQDHLDAGSVILQGDEKNRLEQGSYSLEHAQLKADYLFIVPTGHDQYQILFSREKA